MAKPEQYYEFTKMREGGLSRAKTDTASKYPAPCSFTYKGVTASDWHTNKGIIWPTFKEIAPLVGVPATCERFFKMSDEDWQKIFNEIWRRAGGYDINNTALANTVFQMRWGSGPGTALKLLGNWLNEYAGVKPGNFSAVAVTLNKLANTPEAARALFDFLWNKRKNFLISLNQPANLPGWLNGWNKFYSFNAQYLPTVTTQPTPGNTVESPVITTGTKKKRRRVIIGLSLLALAAGGAYYWHRRRKQKRKKSNA
jgi:lysozyme family protein